MWPRCPGIHSCGTFQTHLTASSDCVQMQKPECRCAGACYERSERIGGSKLIVESIKLSFLFRTFRSCRDPCLKRLCGMTRNPATTLRAHYA